MCDDVENVEAEVVEAVHWMMNCHSTSARSSCTWSSSFTPWIASAVSTASYPSRVTLVAPCTSYWPPQATFAAIHLVHAPNHGCFPHRSQQA